MDCIFCKIIAGEIPSAKLYEDENMIIINDIMPQAVKHYLLLPKEHYAGLDEMTVAQGEILGRCLAKIKELASDLGLDGGYRIVSNCKENACQSVRHLHIHILGGEKLSEKMC